MLWIADTGSGNHLSSPSQNDSGTVSLKKACSDDVRLATANGQVSPEGELDVHLPELRPDARLLVLKSCPRVLSVGRLVGDHGLEFHWTPGRAFFQSSGGQSFECEVRNDVPMLEPSAQAGQASNPCDAETPDTAEVWCLPVGNGKAHEDPDPEEMSKSEYINHLRTHLPKNPNCDIWNGGTMRQRPARRRVPVLPRDPLEWGDTLLADNLTVGGKNADLALGVGKERYGPLLKDLGTAVNDFFASKKKSKASCVMAIREFGGSTRWQTLASDNAPELISAAREEYMTHATSTPWRPESNGLIEREIGIISDGTRAMLAQSSLGHPWWIYASRAFCHHTNVSICSGTDGKTPWFRKHGSEFRSRLFPFGCEARYRQPIPYRSGLKFDIRGYAGMFLGYHLAPGGHLQGDCLVADPEDLMNVKDQKARIYRIKEVSLPSGGPTFPLRTARIAVTQRRLEENIESGHLDDAEPTSDIEDRDGLTTADAIEDGAANGPVRHVRDGVTTDDGDDDEDDPEVEHEAPAAGSSQKLVRIPRASRICIPRVGPPPREPAVHLDLAMGIVFDQENPKRADTLIHNLYEQFEGAKTVAEAIELGATKGHIRYELKQGTARFVPLAEAPAAAAASAAAAQMIIFAAAGVDVPGRAPLIEAWCSEDSPLGKTGDDLKPARNVVLFTVKEDLSREQIILDALEEVGKHRGTHLHGSLPCTPWSSWQRLNLKKGGPSVQAKVARERAQSLEFIKTFVRVAWPVLDAGGSVTFEWPRWCDGWKQPELQLMIKILKLTPVNIDGCAVGVRAEEVRQSRALVHPRVF